MQAIYAPLLIKKGGGVCNPSVLLDGGDIIFNLRSVNYILEVSTGRFKSAHGDCNYHHPCKDMHLRTENYLSRLTADGDFTLNKVVTEDFDSPAKWSFVGLEDARLVRWDGHLYLCGCRRDVKEDGQSRMELTEVDADGREVARFRIPAPGDDSSYCEKNWMPVLDEPYTFVKWSNPTEVVRYDIGTGRTETAALVEQTPNATADPLLDLRGSSQVVTVGDCRYAIVHEVELNFNRYGERSGRYHHRIVCWDKEWNIKRVSERFHFEPNTYAEFTCGLAYDADNKRFLIPYAVMDNTSFLLTLPEDVFFDFLYGRLTPPEDTLGGGDRPAPTLGSLHSLYVHHPSPQTAEGLARAYYALGDYAGAFTYFHIAADLYALDGRYKDAYTPFWMCQQCLLAVRGRDENVYLQLFQVVESDPDRPEAWYDLARLAFSGVRDATHHEALAFAEMAVRNSHNWRGGDGVYDTAEHLRFIEWAELYKAMCLYRMCRDAEATDIVTRLARGASDPALKEKIAGELDFMLGK